MIPHILVMPSKSNFGYAREFFGLEYYPGCWYPTYPATLIRWNLCRPNA